MPDTNGTETPFEEKITDNQREIQHAEDNFGEHNMLSLNELQDLRNDRSPEGLERLRGLAEHYDIPFDGLSSEDIINRIRSALDNQDAPYMFNGTE
jgi:hypothetical protein